MTKQEYNQQWRALNKDRIREYNRRRHASDPAKLVAERKRCALKRKYGITEAQHSEMQVAQNGKCALCNKEAPLRVDHCHKTGRIRGLLCHHCNVGLGHFKDQPELLIAAAGYLSANGVG